MTPHPTLQWHEILAAYADGEFEGRDDVALLKQRVEDWLKSHPEAQGELAEYRRLKQLWQETTPADPAAETWRGVLTAIQTGSTTAPSVPRLRWRLVVAVAAPLAACVAIAVMWSLLRGPETLKPVVVPPHALMPTEDYEVLCVAKMDEVEILRVEGADTGTLVVGALPVHGPLELADPGDVTVTSVEPDSRDQMVPLIRAAGRPMIWARLDNE